MRGHEPIIAMRQRGKRPAMVYLDLERDHSPMKAWQDWPDVHPAVPSVWIQPEDVPNRLDLRFLLGLTAVVTGHDAQRVQAVEAAAIEAGALRVIAAEIDPQGFRTVRVSDSAGELGDGVDSPMAERTRELLGQHVALMSGGPVYG